MRKSLAMILLPLIAGCASAPPPAIPAPVSGEALCDGLDPLVNEHVDALIADGGPRSKVSGRRLVAAYDAGCDKVKGPR